jgi:hypothetical protein
VPVKVEWHTDLDRVLIGTSEGDCKVEDVYKSIQQTHDLLENDTEPYDAIVVYTNARFLPGNYLSTTNYVATRGTQNATLTVGVGLTGFMKTLAQIAHKFAPNMVPGIIVATKEEALEVIKKHRQTRQPNATTTE